MIKKRGRTNQPSRTFSSNRPGSASGRGKPRLNGGKKFGGGALRKKPSFEKAEDKYKDTPAMSVAERKAAQLAKWRKELGLDSD